MVAARQDDVSDVFWIAQVEEVHKNSRVVPETLTARWFGPSGRKASNLFEAAYMPAIISNSTGRKNKRPMEG